MQNLKLEDEHGSTKGYFSQGNKKISWNKHQVFPERKYKRTWKSLSLINMLSLNKRSTYIAVCKLSTPVSFPLTLLRNILPKSWRKYFVQSLHFPLSFQNVHGWTKDWRISKNPWFSSDTRQESWLFKEYTFQFPEQLYCFCGEVFQGEIFLHFVMYLWGPKLNLINLSTRSVRLGILGFVLKMSRIKVYKAELICANICLYCFPYAYERSV